MLTFIIIDWTDGNSNSQERFGDDEQDLVIDISHVFEYVPRREVREVFYAVRCGPVIVRRRRRDAEIEIVQVGQPGYYTSSGAENSSREGAQACSGPSRRRPSAYKLARFGRPS